MATQKEVLKASIALKNGSEIEFEVIVEYSQHREHDDYTSWCETELWGTEIDCMTAEEAKAYGLIDEILTRPHEVAQSE